MQQENRDKVFPDEHGIKKQIDDNKSVVNVSSIELTTADLNFLKHGESVIDSVKKRMYVKLGDDLYYSALTKL